MLTYTFDVQGMTCGHCSARVRTALERIDGALEVHVDHDADIASVRAEDAVLLEDLLDAIEFSGYDAALRTQASAPGARERPEDAPAVDRAALGPPGSALERFGIEGMTCASCVARVERALMGVEGVARARVNYATEQAEVVLAVDAPGGAASIARAAVKAVEAAGYVAVHRPVLVTQPGESSTPLVRASERRAQDAAAWRGRWRAGAALTLPIVALQMGPEMLGLTLPAPADALVMGSAAYLTALTLWCTGRPFFEGALRAARHGATTMDTLVALGAGVAFVSSLAALVLGVDGWPMAFDAAAMIVTLIAVGKWLEARAKGRAAESLESLLHLGADRARVRREGKWIEVDVGELAVGDEVLVRAGEKIPTDAVILEGKAGVDESMITGESRAALREEGDEVVGGSIDTDGRLVVQVTRDASEGTLAEIVRLVEQAQGAKTDAQRLADRVSAVFVPAIMALSLGTFAAWALALGSVAGALTPAVAVLIVACPCALGLATPVAIMVGSGVGAQLGIVVRDAAALERARQIGAIVLDKTGTLTCGEPEVCGVYIAPGEELEDVVRLAASLESSAQHPLAEAIIRYADARGIECLDASEVRVVAGEGLEGNVDGRVVAVGRVDWVSAACEGALDDALVDAQHDALAQGDTVVGVRMEGRVVGVLALRDEPKDGASELVAWLEERGVDTWMITGDEREAASSVAAAVGVSPERVLAGVRPEDKAVQVRRLREEQRVRVAMVGDGINDAPALAEADLGIALGTGTDVAMSTAHLTLISGELDGVRRAIQLSERTHRKIRQNLFWAFAYNATLVPVAALGALMPAMAAGAMALSSVSVVTNALLLRRYDFA